MNRRRALLRHVVLALAALLFATAWTPLQQAAQPSVKGQVVNGTAGGVVPSGLPVTVHVFSENETAGLYSTTVGEDGSFRLDDVTLKEGETIVASVAYGDLTYSSEPTLLESGTEALDVQVTIYETTEDKTGVGVTQLHIFATRSENQIQVGEFYVVGNTTDRTYVGALDAQTNQRITLVYALPNEGEVESLRYGLEQEGRYLRRATSIADTEPVRPGKATVETYLSYELPLVDGLWVERPVPFPVASIVLVLPQADGIVAQGDQVVSTGSLDTQAGPADSYAVTALEAGETFAFQLAFRAQSSVPATPESIPLGRNRIREIGIGLASLWVALVAVYLLWRQPEVGPAPAAAIPTISAIAAMDEESEAGGTGNRASRRQRDALKRRLRDLLADRHDD